MSFAENIALIPYEPTTAEATGFLPPVFRAIGHLMLTLAIVADENLRDQTDDNELLGEIRDAKNHWNAINTNQALSTTATDKVNAFGNALNSAIDEFSDWDEITRTQNLRNLANRAVGLTALLDRELIGLRDSNPGYNL